ncbi:MAG: hypothetical protein ACYTBJ_01185 [Planctomycetota bacterium]|jgi:hypothetical protein
MTSWTDLETTGKGEVVYLLEIVGIGVFTTYNYTPTDSWFTSAGYGASRVYDILTFEELGPIKEEIDFMEGSLKVSGISAKLSDVNGEMTSLLKNWKSHTFTWLKASATDTATTFTANDTSQFSTTNDIYIGQEVCSVGTIPDATTFAGLARAQLGTIARPYTVSLDPDSGVLDQPVITNAPHVLVGRKCYVHAAAMVDGSPGSTSVIYRGIVKKGIRIRDEEWEIPIDHISTVFKRKIGQNMPQSEIVPGISANKLSYNWRVVTSSTTEVTDGFINTGFYTHEELADELESSINDVPPDIKISLRFNGEKYIMSAPAESGKHIVVMVYTQDALHCLGFKPGHYYGAINAPFEIEADDPPWLLGINVPFHNTGSNSKIEVRDGSVFTANTYVQVQENVYAKIDSISGNELELKANSWDRNRRPDPPFIRIKDDKDKMILRQCFVFEHGSVILPGAPMRIKAALEKALFLESGQTEPEEWCATGISSADIDFDELDDAMANTPEEFNTWLDCVVKPISVQKLFGPLFGLLGIAPRVTTEGKIGFTRIKTPNPLDVESVKVDTAVWDLISAAQTETTIGGSPLVNQVIIQHSFNYVKGKFGAPVKIWWKDGFNQLAANRTIKYQIRGFQVGFQSSLSSPVELSEFYNQLNQQLSVTHYGMFGREIFVADIPCTWLARQFSCGDIVHVTHDIIRDVSAGSVGVEDRLGIVIGKTTQTTENKGDSLVVMFGPAGDYAGLGPCAYATTTDAGNDYVLFSNADTPFFEQGSDNDLKRFDRDNVRIRVLFIERDSTNPTVWSATIASNGVFTNPAVGEPYIEVTTMNNFPGTFPANGAYMVLADWDNAAAWMQDYCYLADNDSTPSLGTGEDDPHEWGI